MLLSKLKVLTTVVFNLWNVGQVNLIKKIYVKKISELRLQNLNFSMSCIILDQIYIKNSFKRWAPEKSPVS